MIQTMYHNRSIFSGFFFLPSCQSSINLYYFVNKEQHMKGTFNNDNNEFVFQFCLMHSAVFFCLEKKQLSFSGIFQCVPVCGVCVCFKFSSLSTLGKQSTRSVPLGIDKVCADSQ
jgi:hypothetical protein